MKAASRFSACRCSPQDWACPYQWAIRTPAWSIRSTQFATLEAPGTDAEERLYALKFLGDMNLPGAAGAHHRVALSKRSSSSVGNWHEDDDMNKPPAKLRRPEGFPTPEVG